MRRDYFTLDVRGLEWLESDAAPEKPTVAIDFEGPASLLQDRITSFSAELLEESEIDVSFRYQTDVDEIDAHGVVSITDRITGDYVLELNADADDVVSFIRAAREYGNQIADDESRYSIEVSIDSDDIVTYNKRTFLIYDSDGNLLRNHSLIPSGVEL